MHIHLADIMNREGEIWQTQAELEWETFFVQSDSFMILAKSPISLSIVNTGNKVLKLTGKGSVTVAIPCDRCLEKVAVEFPLDICRRVDMKLSKEDRIKELDESNYITGTDLDIDQFVYDEVLMQWPLKVLCSKTCKGICSQCGQNLNHGTCGCEKESLDPRMAAVRDIFSKFKEV